MTPDDQERMDQRPASLMHLLGGHTAQRLFLALGIATALPLPKPAGVIEGEPNAPTATSMNADEDRRVRYVAAVDRRNYEQAQQTLSTEQNPLVRIYAAAALVKNPNEPAERRGEDFDRYMLQEIPKALRTIASYKGEESGRLPGYAMSFALDAVSHGPSADKEVRAIFDAIDQTSIPSSSRNILLKDLAQEIGQRTIQGYSTTGMRWAADQTDNRIVNQAQNAIANLSDAGGVEDAQKSLQALTDAIAKFDHHSSTRNHASPETLKAAMEAEAALRPAYALITANAGFDWAMKPDLDTAGRGVDYVNNLPKLIVDTKGLDTELAAKLNKINPNLHIKDYKQQMAELAEANPFAVVDYVDKVQSLAPDRLAGAPAYDRAMPDAVESQGPNLLPWLAAIAIAHLATTHFGAQIAAARAADARGPGSERGHEEAGIQRHGAGVGYSATSVRYRTGAWSAGAPGQSSHFQSTRSSRAPTAPSAPRPGRR